MDLSKALIDHTAKITAYLKEREGGVLSFADRMTIENHFHELATRLRAAEADRDLWKTTATGYREAERMAFEHGVCWKARAEAAEALVLEQYEDTLLHHSYEHTNPQYAGWMYHSCMSDQEEALSVLVKAGLYELHPERPALFRRTPTPTPATGQETTR